jgi:hypothetical protein
VVKHRGGHSHFAGNAAKTSQYILGNGLALRSLTGSHNCSTFLHPLRRLHTSLLDDEIPREDWVMLIAILLFFAQAFSTNTSRRGRALYFSCKGRLLLNNSSVFFQRVFRNAGGLFEGALSVATKA